MSIFLRKEWFGGIIGDPKTYDLYLINKQAFREISDFYQKGTAISSHLELQLSNRGIGLNSKYHITDNGDPRTKAILSSPIILWLEITNQCNSNCIHCFRKSENNVNTLSTNKLIELINESYEMGVFKITVTGGEPLLHEDFNVIAQAINDTGMNLRVFTGSNINVNHLKRINFQLIDHLFVSLDGDKEHNDLLRGTGAFYNVRRLLDIVRESKCDIKISLSSSIDNYNWRNFEDIIAIAKQYQIKSILTRPLFGCQSNPSLHSFEFTDKYTLTNAINTIIAIANADDIEIQLNKIPYFPIEKMIYYDDSKSTSSIWNILNMESVDCVGGNLVMGIKYNGDVLPCGFINSTEIPYKSFNVMEYSLKSLWLHDRNVNWMRNINPSLDCSNCNYLKTCNGGCRANSLNFGHGLRNTDQYCLFSNTDLGEATPILKVEQSTEKFFDIESENAMISTKKLSTKCGWSTYDV